MIPPLIHLYWHDEHPPLAFDLNAERLELMNPGWTVHRWTPDNLGPLINQSHFDRAGVYAEPDRVEVLRSDLARVELLLVMGGIYVDYDWHALRPFGELPERDCYLGDNGRNPDLAVLGSVPGHPLMHALTRQFGQLAPHDRRRQPGCNALQRVLPLDGVRVLPSWVFYPANEVEYALGWGRPT